MTTTESYNEILVMKKLKNSEDRNYFMQMLTKSFQGDNIAVSYIKNLYEFLDIPRQKTI
jgi:hypothetical protein